MVRFRQAARFIEAWDISRPLALGARAGLGSTGRLDHLLGCSSIGGSTCLADKRLRVRSSSIPPSYPDIGQLDLLRVIRDHEIAGLNPAIRTRLEPVLISLLREPLFAGSSPAFPTIIGK